jgi:hypothetical protein
MKARVGEIIAGWNKREKDFGWAWGDGAEKATANLVGYQLFETPTIHGTKLTDELAKRGYDPKSIRFSVKRATSTNGAVK